MRADVAIPGVRPAVRCVKNAEHHQSPRATRRCPRCHEYAGSACRSARHPARIVRSPGGGNAAAHSPQQVRRRGLLARRPRTRRGAVLQLPQRRTLRRVRRKSTLRPGDSGAKRQHDFVGDASAEQGGEVRRPTLPFHPLRRRHAYGRIGIIYGRGAIKTNGVGQRDFASCTKRNPPRCSDCECFLEHVYGFRRQRSGAWCKTRIIWGGRRKCGRAA